MRFARATSTINISVSVSSERRIETVIASQCSTIPSTSV